MGTCIVCELYILKNSFSGEGEQGDSGTQPRLDVGGCRGWRVRGPGRGLGEEVQLGVKTWSGDQRDLKRAENKGLEVLKKSRGRGGGEDSGERMGILRPEVGTQNQIEEVAKMRVMTRSWVSARGGFCGQVEKKVTKGRRPWGKG